MKINGKLVNGININNGINNNIKKPEEKTNDFKNLLYSVDFNKKYFSIYFIIKNIDILKKYNIQYESILDQNHIKESENEILQYFLDEIDNLASIDKLKIMKNHFKALKIPKEKYIEKYRLYKIEIRELERRVYLKKFSYLKLLMEKYNLNKELTYYFGDETRDIEGANKAKVNSVAVGWGFNSIKAHKLFKPTHIVTSVEQILDLV